MGEEKLMSNKTYDIFIQLRGMIITEISDDDKMKMACELLEDFTYSLIEDAKKGNRR